jgi:Ser/Thr protein kinase RdoA (MazF antagonist)
LIHGDFGETNYRFQGDRLTVFDFDDCCRHWFAYDLAVTIYPHGWRREGLQLLEHLLEGYAEKTSLNTTLAELTMFCQWRQIYMFLVYARKWGFNDLSPQQAEWFARKRENIVRGYEWRK